MSKITKKISILSMALLLLISFGQKSEASGYESQSIYHNASVQSWQTASYYYYYDGAYYPVVSNAYTYGTPNGGMYIYYPPSQNKNQVIESEKQSNYKSKRRAQDYPLYFDE